MMQLRFAHLPDYQLVSIMPTFLVTGKTVNLETIEWDVREISEILVLASQR
jgi:hypothetical protein